jgi:hypothetical protein
MTYGGKGGVLLALALGCSTRSLNLDLRGEGGRVDGVPSGGHMGTGGAPPRGCFPEDDGASGRTAPVSFDGLFAAGAPTFVQAAPTPIAGSPGAIALADLDADGRLDVVVAADGILSVLLNAGAGALAAPVAYPITAGSTSIAIGDVDGDGRPDIAVGGEGRGRVELLLNTGGARFRNVALCLCGGLSPSVALGDLDGDGSTDVVVANRVGEDGRSSGDLVVLLNDDASPFKNDPAHYAAGGEPRSVAVQDVNGDARPDVIVAGVCGVSVLLNAGGGQLAHAVRYETVTGSITLADLDGDGDVDIVDTGTSAWTADVLLNDGKGVFGAPSGNPVASPAQTALGDLNGDGFADLVVAQGAAAFGFGIMLNDGGGRFGSLFEYARRSDHGADYRAVAIGDVDGDASPDVVLAGGAGVTVYLNRPR